MLVLGALCLAASFALFSPGPASAYTPPPCGPNAKPATACPFPADPDNGYPARQPAYTYNDCLWGYVLNPNNALTNQAGIDANNAYYSANFTMRPHSKIILHGQFPHARFYSFTTYGTVDGTVGIATSWIFDHEINAGSRFTEPVPTWRPPGRQGTELHPDDQLRGQTQQSGAQHAVRRSRGRDRSGPGRQRHDADLPSGPTVPSCDPGEQPHGRSRATDPRDRPR